MNQEIHGRCVPTAQHTRALRTSMLSIPLKGADAQKVDWEKGLSKYVARAYSSSLAETHKDQFAAVHEKRQVVVGISARGLSPLSVEESQSAMLSYYRLLVAMESRFHGADLRMGFSWRDGFNNVVKQGESDLHFESAAVLFNLMAAHSFSAVQQVRSSGSARQRPVRLRAACEASSLPRQARPPWRDPAIHNRNGRFLRANPPPPTPPPTPPHPPPHPTARARLSESRRRGRHPDRLPKVPADGRHHRGSPGSRGGKPVGRERDDRHGAGHAAHAQDADAGAGAAVLL